MLHHHRPRILTHILPALLTLARDGLRMLFVRIHTKGRVPLQLFSIIKLVTWRRRVFSRAAPEPTWKLLRSRKKINRCPRWILTCIFIFWNGADVHSIDTPEKHEQTCMTWHRIEYIWRSTSFRSISTIWTFNIERNLMTRSIFRQHGITLRYYVMIT